MLRLTDGRPRVDLASFAWPASAGAAAALQPITEHAPKVGMAMIRAISERVLMGGDEAADEDALYAETPARWKPSPAEIAHLDVCTLGPEGCAPGPRPCVNTLDMFLVHAHCWLCSQSSRV